MFVLPEVADLITPAELGRSKPRSIGVWRVTHPVEGRIGPPEISQITGPISKIQTSFDSPVREIFKHGAKFDLEVINDVPGQVKVGMFDFSDLVTSASVLLMFSANKANGSA